MGARILVTGASGFLGARLVQEALARGMDAAGASRKPFGREGWEGVDWFLADLSRQEEARELIDRARPRWVIHAAAVSRISDCDRDPERAVRVNRDGTAALARAAARRGAGFLFVSTDQVFHGESAPYGPDDRPSPVSLYGRTKAEAEEVLRDEGGDWRVVRVSLLYGLSPGRGNRGASEGLLDLLRRGERPLLFTDEFRTPLAVDQAARALLDLLEAPPGRIYHLAGPERISRYDFGVLTARAAGLDPGLLRAGKRADRPEHAGRPADLSLDCRETEPFLREKLLSPREALPGRVSLSGFLR